MFAKGCVEYSEVFPVAPVFVPDGNVEALGSSRDLCAFGTGSLGKAKLRWKCKAKDAQGYQAGNAKPVEGKCCLHEVDWRDLLKTAK